MSNRTESLVDTVYAWECRYCDAALAEHTSGQANRAGLDHLMENHRAELEQHYLGIITGEHCQRGCGYQFPRNPDAIASFVCPECDTDNLSYFVGKAVWDGIELR